ncbi:MULTISPECIES: c-type cytochrome [Alteribacter]|uniref:Cytochrome c n=1 Tax=Alteribacter keqinensis TaxID=2483800 RepID=A0A3M7TQ11_9BACI|nr:MULTISPECIES: cytochrome c [Alteribacter]MBM7096881.1 cytochrome c [Alteribacter salitolerans]RNA67535.1 cytochrome c [Alteribacter keqinensis]
MKKWLIPMMGAVLVLAACGGGDDDTTPVDEGDDAVEETEDDAEETAGDGEYDLAAGEEVYEQNCLSCHGQNGEGGSGPGIAGLDMDSVRAAIEEGPGSMPPELVDGDEADNVSAWVADQ